MSLNRPTIKHSLRQLAPIIRKDPKSWVDWTAIQMSIEIRNSSEPSIYPQDELEKLINHSLENHDFTSYFCKMGELTIITEGVSTDKLESLAREVKAFLGLHNNTLTKQQIYNLGKDWRRFTFMCERKGSQTRTTMADSNFDSNYLLVAEEAEELFAMYHQQNNVIIERKKTKVMVVEDDPLTRKIISKTLKDEVDLVVTSNLHEGLINYALHQPDLVFLDISLEHTNDGKIFLHTVRQYDNHSQIIMFSGNSYLENRIDTFNMGADGFIAKPFRKEQLMYYIEQVV